MCFSLISAEITGGFGGIHLVFIPFLTREHRSVTDEIWVWDEDRDRCRQLNMSVIWIPKQTRLIETASVSLHPSVNWLVQKLKILRIHTRQVSSSWEAVTGKKLRPWRITNRLLKNSITYITFDSQWRIWPKIRVALGFYIISVVFLCPALAPRIQKED